MPEETLPQSAAGDGAAAPEAPVAAAGITPHTATPGLLTPAAEIAAEAPAEQAAEATAEGGEQDGTEPAPTAAETEAKPDAEAGAQEEAKPESEPEAEKPEALPPLTYDEPLQLPEGIEADPDGVAKFDELIGGERVSPEARQKLADMHVERLRNYAIYLAQEQQDAFGRTRHGWREDIVADPELGGANLDTNRAAAARMIDRLVPPDRRDKFNEAMSVTGMTDNPEMFRLLLSVAKILDEPSSPPSPRNPPPDLGRPQGNGLRSIYTHPRSPR